MILGSIAVQDGAVLTHRDSFILSNVSVVSVRRPYLAGAVLLSGGFIGFVATFADLLYPDEAMAVVAGVLSLLIIGFNAAQLTLLSRDLKGTELTSAVWGTAGDLHKARARIVAERQRSLDRPSRDPRSEDDYQHDHRRRDNYTHLQGQNRRRRREIR